MTETLINNEKYQQEIDKYYQFAKRELGIENDPTYILNFEPQQEENQLKHKTALYDADSNTIWLMCHGRHIKDILRSFGHELIHAMQKLNGELTDDVMDVINNDYNIENPTIQAIEGPAFQNGSFLLRKYTQSLNENIYDVFSQYVTKMDNKRKEEQKQQAKKIMIKKQNQSTENKPKKQKENKFDKLEELKPTLSEFSYISGPNKPRRNGQEPIQEFDTIFQEIFTDLLGQHGFELETYSEPGLYYEYSRSEENYTIIITMLPNGIKNNDKEQIENAILSITIQEKNSKETYDFTFNKIEKMYKKLKNVLKTMKGNKNEPT